MLVQTIISNRLACRRRHNLESARSNLSRLLRGKRAKDNFSQLVPATFAVVGESLSPASARRNHSVSAEDCAKNACDRGRRD